MAREKPYYRDIVADLSDKFSGKVIVRIGEVCDVLKITPRSARARFIFDKGGYVTIYAIAKCICDAF